MFNSYVKLPEGIPGLREAWRGRRGRRGQRDLHLGGAAAGRGEVQPPADGCGGWDQMG
jgi:hypothetical protein